MKNLFGIVLFLILSVAAQAQDKAFPKGKMDGDIIGKGDVRFEVVKMSPTTVHFYPIDEKGDVKKNAPKTLEFSVLYLAEHTSEISNPELKDGKYTVYLDPNKIVYYYFINGQDGKEKIEMKEQMVMHGR